jgi:hypothetical protein
MATKSESPNTQTKYKLDFDMLRRLRTELQQLQETMQTVAKGYVRLDSCNTYIQKTVEDIKQIIKEIEENEKQSLHYSDDMRCILNLWEQMKDSPLLSCPPGKTLDAQEQTHALTVFEAQIKEMIFEIGFLTIPDRLNRWIERSTPGHYIPFHDIFENEMPDYGDRVKLLNFIAWAPKTLIKGGIVEPETGLIHCYEKNDRKRRAGYYYLVSAFILVTGIIASLAYIPLEGWPLLPKDVFSLLFGWAALVIGVVVHLGIDTNKRQQKTTLPAIIAFNDLPLLINAKYGQVMLKIFLSLVGFAGLVFAVGINNAKPINAFFVGYSLDSFIGILTASMEQKGSAQLATIKQQLGVAEKG